MSAKKSGKNTKRIVVKILCLLLILIIVIMLIVINYKRKRNKKDDIENTIINEQQKESNEKYVLLRSDGSKVNVSPRINKSKKLDGFEFTDIQIKSKNKKTIITANVKNTLGISTDFTIVDVILYNDKGSTIATIEGLIKKLQPGEDDEFTVVITDDYANTYDLSIVKK